jgi:hypothetical protein
MEGNTISPNPHSIFEKRFARENKPIDCETERVSLF